MAAGEGEETAVLTTRTATSTPSTSPKSKLKIVCSHGGNILPRPIDGHLKYVDGETRVVCLPRDITFSELMQKLTITFEGDMVLKYQLIPEELDALVSVRTDDDLRHMVDEYERQESGGSPKLRAFLFPSTPIVVVQNQTTPGGDRQLPLEQRYIDAVNGIVRKGRLLAPISVNNRPFSISSACSSPKPVSPEDDQESIFSNAYQNNVRLRSMHKVRSSPSLSNLDHQHNNNPYNNHSHHHVVHPTSYQHHYHHDKNHAQLHKHHSSSTSRPPQDPHRTSVNERLVSPMHNSRVDSLRGQMSCCIPNSDYYYYHSHMKNPRAASVYGSINTFQHIDDRKLDRADTLPRSPRRMIWD